MFQISSAIAATPENIVGLTGETAELLNAWWSIWSSAQLSAIEEIYTDSADIFLPGSKSTAMPNELFHYVLDKYSRLTRVFCQIEKLAIEDNKVAVKWYLDGDEKGSRIRIPFISLLTLEQGKIVSDKTSCDILAYLNRFKDSELFNLSASE